MTLFQFHHGTIGRILGPIKMRTSIISIPPRYDWENFIAYVCKIFIIISIPPRYDWEAYAALAPIPVVGHFNSTTVRLGVRQKAQKILSLIISIPPRYDWEDRFSAVYCVLCIISIPPRYDWERVGAMVIHTRISISIPPRYDWEPVCATCRKPLRQFQFHHGTIGS